MTLQAGMLVLLCVGFAVYVAAKVYALNRQSQRDWENTDKSRLKEWEDEDDWN